MVPIIQPPAEMRPQRAERAEFEHGGAGLDQLREESVGRRVRAGRVVDHGDAHAFRELPAEQGGERRAGGVHVLERVVFHVDVVARGRDRREDRRHRIGPARQQAHRVAVPERAIGDRLMRRGVPLERSVVLVVAVRHRIPSRSRIRARTPTGEMRSALRRMRARLVLTGLPAPREWRPSRGRCR